MAALWGCTFSLPFKRRFSNDGTLLHSALANGLGHEARGEPNYYFSHAAPSSAPPAGAEESIPEIIYLAQWNEGMLDNPEDPQSEEEAAARIAGLLERGEADVNAVDHDGASVMAYATNGGNALIVSLLLRRGARLDCASATNGFTPLTAVMYRPVTPEHVNCLKLLLALPPARAAALGLDLWHCDTLDGGTFSALDRAVLALRTARMGSAPRRRLRRIHAVSLCVPRLCRRAAPLLRA